MVIDTQNHGNLARPLVQTVGLPVRHEHDVLERKQLRRKRRIGYGNYTRGKHTIGRVT